MPPFSEGLRPAGGGGEVEGEAGEVGTAAERSRRARRWPSARVAIFFLGDFILLYFIFSCPRGVTSGRGTRRRGASGFQVRNTRVPRRSAQGVDYLMAVGEAGRGRIVTQTHGKTRARGRGNRAEGARGRPRRRRRARRCAFAARDTPRRPGNRARPPARRRGRRRRRASCCRCPPSLPAARFCHGVLPPPPFVPPPLGPPPRIFHPPPSLLSKPPPSPPSLFRQLLAWFRIFSLPLSLSRARAHSRSLHLPITPSVSLRSASLACADPRLVAVAAPSAYTTETNPRHQSEASRVGKGARARRLRLYIASFFDFRQSFYPTPPREIKLWPPLRSQEQPRAASLTSSQQSSPHSRIRAPSFIFPLASSLPRSPLPTSPSTPSSHRPTRFSPSSADSCLASSANPPPVSSLPQRGGPFSSTHTPAPLPTRLPSRLTRNLQRCMHTRTGSHWHPHTPRNGRPRLVPHALEEHVVGAAVARRRRRAQAPTGQVALDRRPDQGLFPRHRGCQARPGGRHGPRL